MRKINKIITIVLIFMLIGANLYQNFAYSSPKADNLRPALQFSPLAEETARKLDQAENLQADGKLNALRTKLLSNGYTNPDMVISFIGLDEKIADFIIQHKIEEKEIGSVYRAIKTLGYEETLQLKAIGVPWESVDQVGIACRDNGRENVMLVIEIMKDKEGEILWKHIKVLSVAVKRLGKDFILRLIGIIKQETQSIPWGSLKDIAFTTDVCGDNMLKDAISLMKEMNGKVDWNNVSELEAALYYLPREKIKSLLTEQHIPVNYIDDYAALYVTYGEDFVLKVCELHRKYRHGNIVWSYFAKTAENVTSYGYENVDRIYSLVMQEWGFIPWKLLKKLMSNIGDMKDGKARDWLNSVMEELKVDLGALPEGASLKTFNARFLCFPQAVTNYDHEHAIGTRAMGLFLDDKEVEEEERSGGSIDESHIPGSFGNIFFFEKSDRIIIDNFQNNALVSTSNRFVKKHRHWDKMLMLAIEVYARKKNIKYIYFTTPNCQLIRWKEFNTKVAEHLYSELQEQFGYELKAVDKIVMGGGEVLEVAWVKHVSEIEKGSGEPEILSRSFQGRAVQVILNGSL